MLDHQDKYMMKAQVHVLNTFAISDEQPLPQRKYHCQHNKSIKCDGNNKVIKGIKREFSNARTPQQNGVAEKRNKTLIEAARTMLADAKLLVTFWAEAANTAYHLGKFDAKGVEGYFVRYSMSSKAFRVFNKRTKKVEENLHVDFLENKLIEKGAGLNWLFDIDTLTNFMNYVPVVVVGTTSTNISGIKDVASQGVKKDVSSLRYISLPNWFHEAHMESSNNDAQDACNVDASESSGISNPTATLKSSPAKQMESLTVESIIPTVSSPVHTTCLDTSRGTTSGSRLISKEVISQEETSSLDNALTLSNRFEDILGDTTNTVDTNGVEADLSNMESIIPASLTPTLIIHKDHLKSQIISLVDTPVQTRHKSKEMEEHSFIATIHQKTTPDLIQFCLFLCFLSQEEPKKIFDALKDPSWVESMQEELLQFKIQNVWILVDCPKGVRPIGIKWVLKNKKVYQMDVKSAFLYGTIDEEVYVMQPPGFQDPESANTPMDKENPWGKDGPGKDVELHLYRSMIGSLMYLTASRPYIMFAVCAYSRHQVTPKECHLHAVKRIFRYLKGHPKLRLWYPKESLFDLVAYSDSDYGGATQDKKSTTGGCQFLGRRLISWQCKKQTIVATSTTKAEYIAAASGCGQFWSTAWIETTNEGTKILATVDGKPRTISESSIRRNLKMNDEGEGSGTPTEPHHIPSLEAQQSPHHDLSSSLHPTKITEAIPTETPIEIPTLRQYSRRATRIAQSKALPTAADEPASLSRDDSQGEAFPTISGLDAGQDKENIIKTSALPHDSTPTVTSLDVDECSMKQQLQELTDLYTRLQRQQTEMASKINAQDLEISNLKARIKLLEDKDTGSAELSGDDAPINGRSMEIGEEAGVERSIERGSNDIEEMVNVLTSIDAARILTSKVADVSVPPITEVSTIGVPTVSGFVPTVSAIFTTASVRKNLQEQIDVQVAREMEEEMAREDQRLNEQIARDAEIARIHAEEELKMLIDGLDRNNEMIAKHLHEYEQAAADLTIGEKIELINELVIYQDYHAKILKYQAQQSKPLSKKEQREFYMSVLRSHSGWKTKHFRGMPLKEIRENFIPVLKKIEDFVPMSSKEEAKRFKKKGLRLEEGSAKKMKTLEDVSEEDIKEMIQLVLVEEVYVETLQVKHSIIDWEIHSEGQRDYWKIIRLGGHTSVYQFFVDMLTQLDREDLN
nr:uncharacterized mitochondrial protein AtMg00810-like [Tanacetum cinerariifolium]